LSSSVISVSSSTDNSSPSTNTTCFTFTYLINEQSVVI
jgi:hypothetical protein